MEEVLDLFGEINNSDDYYENEFIPKNEYEQKCDGSKCNINLVNPNGQGIDTKFV